MKLHLIAAVPVSLVAAQVLGYDFSTQMVSLDQPRVNALVSRTPGGTPLEDATGTTFNIQAFFDTGASGILLSRETAYVDDVNYFGLGIQKATFNGQDVIFEDVGVGGSVPFNVSEPLYLSIAPFTPTADLDNPSTYNQVYNQQYGPVRTQIGPLGPPNPLGSILGGLDVIGMPAFRGKVVVMDNRPVNSFLDTMRTYVYNPGTAFNPGSIETDPGIVPTQLSVRTSYVDVDRFTTITPVGAPGPTLSENPFIGPNPFGPSRGRRDTTPPVTISYNGNTAKGSFLLDTGAAASIISRDLAAGLGVTYVPGSYGSETPALLGVPASEQFKLRIGGVGGEIVLAGFYLNSMLLKTEQGDVYNDNDPNHIRFLDAAVLVGDITVFDPDDNFSYTLEGIFGMNFLTATAYFEEATPFPIIADLRQAPFDFVVMDDPNRKLRFTLPGGAPPVVVPEPTSLSLLALAGVALLRRRPTA